MRLLFLFLIALSPFIGQAQVISIANGNWENPLTWDCNCIPNSGLGQITINSDHTVTITTTVAHDDIVIQPNGILTIASGGRLIVEASLVQLEANPPTYPNDAEFNIEAGGILENLGVVESLPASMIFEDGSEYQHNQNNGAIPFATWQAGSTCRITGWAGTNANSSFRATLAQSFHHFIWDSPGQNVGNVTFLGFLSTVNGNLIINNTSTGNRMVSLGGSILRPTLNVGGDFIVNSLGRVSVAVSDGSTFTMNVLGNCNFSSTTGVNNYLIGGSGAAGITNLNMTGDLILNSGQVNLAQNLGAGNISIGGDLELNGGSIIKGLGTGTGNLSFTGAINHSIDVGSGIITATNLTVVSGVLEFTGNPLAIGSNITVQSGATLNLPSTLTTSGDLNFVSGSTINANNGTITLSGSTLLQTINANGATLHNITIDKSIAAAAITLSSSLLVTGQLDIISSGVGTVLNSNGNLTLRSTSDATSGNARIGPLLNTASVSGNVIVQRFMSSEGRIYRYISSPVTNATVSQLQNYFPITGTFTGNNNSCTGCSSNSSMFLYNASLGLGQYAQFPVSANTEQLAPGRGYATFIRQGVTPLPGTGPITFNLTGPINYGDIPLPVFYNAGVPDESWNLVGNPYPSSIDWDDASWTKTSISASIAIRDNGTGNFLYWDGTDGDIVDGVIATGQGFWVRTTASAPTPQLIVREAAKSTTTGEFYREAGSHVISMTLTKGSLYDKAYFKLRDGALPGLDEFDAPKLINDNFDFSTRFADTSPFAINAVNELPCGTELYLDLRFTKTVAGAFVINPEGDYSIGFEIAGAEFDKYEISLLDQFTGAHIPVTAGFAYSFSITSNPASLSADRLKLRFEGVKPSLNLDLAGSDAICGSKEATVIVKNSDNKFEYFLLKDDVIFSEEQSGNGGDLSFVVAGSSLLAGNNQVMVGVRGVCGVEFLTNKWEVTRYPDASITVEEGDILVSNYKEGNQWYFNGELIPAAINQKIKVELSGVYMVVSTGGGCSSNAEIDYAITGIEREEQRGFEVYPNPFVEEIHLISEGLLESSTISVLNSLGQVVSEPNSISQDVPGNALIKLNNLSDGIYFIRVKTSDSVRVIKVIKDSKSRN